MVSVLHQEVRTGFVKEKTSEERVGGDDGVDILRNSFHGRDDSSCNGPWGDLCLVCSRNRRPVWLRQER